MKKAKIQAKRKFKDIELNRIIKAGETYIVSFERAEKISEHPRDLIRVLDIFDDVYDIEVNDSEIVENKKLNLNTLSVKELKEIAKDKNIKTTGLKKSEIISKLIET